MRERFGWLTTRAERTSRLQKFRSYWVWRQRRTNAEFKFYARFLNVQRSLRERRTAVGAAGSIAKTVLFSLVAALAVAAALELLDRLVLQRSSVLRSFLPDGFADRTAHRFTKGASGGEQSLLGTVAQIAGIFLGLYFTAVSAIAAAAYADVPGEVRLLLTREKLGTVYIKIVAFLGALALVLSSALVLGFRIGLLNIALVGILSALSIFAFVVLGLRTFYFFSPDRLTGYVISDMLPLIERSKRGKFGSRHRAIPYNYQRQAEDLLSTLRAIVSLSAERQSVTERSLLDIVQRSLWLLRWYESLKGDIDSSSLWFKQRLEFPKWLTADSTTVDLALRTQTAIQGKQVADRLWVERELYDVLHIALEALLARRDRVRAVEAFERINSWTRVLASQLAIDETLALVHVTGELIETHLTTLPAQERRIESIALADLAASLPMQVVLGMSDRLRPLAADAFAAATTHVDPLKSLESPWPREVILQREYIAERLQNERIVERKRLTADWYVAQLLALSMSRFFARVVPLLLADLEQLPLRAGVRLEGQQTILAAAIVQRGIESCQKFLVHLGEFEACLERLGELRRAKDIPWVETDWEDAHRRVLEVRTQLLVLTARVSVEVSDVETGGEIPDFFGATYAFLAEECFDDALHDRAEKFQRLFPAFFATSLSANERLNRELAGYDQQTQILFSTETLEDLLEISGYALLMNELGQGGCWGVAKDIWDRYLNGRDRTQFFTFLFAVLSYRDSIFGIKPRDIGRSAWRQTFARRLGEMGVRRRRYADPFDLDEDELDVQSPLVSAAITGMGRDAGEAFIAGYLLTWPETQGLDLPRETEQFLESVEFARRRRQEEAEDEEDVPEWEGQPPAQDPSESSEGETAAGDENPHDEEGNDA